MREITLAIQAGMITACPKCNSADIATVRKEKGYRCNLCGERFAKPVIRERKIKSLKYAKMRERIKESRKI